MLSQHNYYALMSLNHANDDKRHRINGIISHKQTTGSITHD